LKKWFLRSLMLISLLIVGLALYGTIGWYDARSDAQMLRNEAQSLVAKGLGSYALGKDNRGLLLLVEDPTFETNNGTDFSTPGAGQTTITQSLSKRLAFDKFTPGIRKIRQTGYAIGLSQSLSKDDVLTLVIAKVGFRGADGEWTYGFDNAGRRFFGKPLAKLDRAQFMLLLATIIAPAELTPDAPNAKLKERVLRIDRLASRKCKPSSHNDVWLEGCKVTVAAPKA
jgi:monofunctional glycosyltransferase